MNQNQSKLNRSLDDAMPSSGLRFGRRGQKINRSMPEVFVAGQVGLSVMGEAPPNVDHNKIELVFPANIDEEAGDSKVIEGKPVSEHGSTQPSVTLNIQETYAQSHDRLRSRSQSSKVFTILCIAIIVCFLLVSAI